MNRPEKYCIIGAGASGLAAAKNLKQRGIPFDVIEREDAVGGIWNYEKYFSPVYASTHLISSKPLTEFTDYPMPEDYPDYPNHQQVLKYLQSYASHFNLYPHIEFNTVVEQITREGDDWQILLNGGEKRRYRGIIIANGHLWDPAFPEIPGHFSGLALHSRDYKTPDILKNRRVLIIGAGNTGCDLSVEAAQNAAITFHSFRRGYHFIPKYALGKPSDQLGEMSLKLRIPLAFRRLFNMAIIRLIVGNPQNFGLPKPDHKLFESHPIMNSQLLFHIGHGNIVPKPDVAEFCNQKVRFKDGSEEEIEVLIYATGYKISFPFIDKKYLNWQEGKPQHYLNIFHPKFDNLFIAGLIQPDSGQWGLVDYQTQLIAEFIRAQQENPNKAERFRHLKAGPQPDLSKGIRYLKSDRHRLEVEHFSYRRRLKKLIRMFQ